MTERIASRRHLHPSFQFSMRDLLLFFALIALYLFAGIRLHQVVSSGFQQYFVNFFLGQVITFSLTFALLNSWNRRKVGKILVEMPYRHPWWLEFVFAIVNICLALFVAPLSDSAAVGCVGALVGSFVLGLFRFQAKLVLGERGVFISPFHFIYWHEISRVDYDPHSANASIRYSFKRKVLKLPISDEHRERVAQILRENGKLPRAEETQIAPCDSHGAK